MNRARAFVCFVSSLSLMMLGACGDMPAALDPHGSNAAQTAHIAWVLFWGGGLIFVSVMALAAYAVLAAPAHRAWLNGRAFVVGAGIVFPIVTLSALLFYTLKVSGEWVGTRDAAPLRIGIVGQMWWWQVRYIDAGARARSSPPTRCTSP